MILNPTAFNAFLSGPVGQDFSWRAASVCPCAPNVTSGPKQTCPLCKGKGWFWGTAVTAGCRAGITNQTPQKAMAIFGTYQTGDAVLTIPSSSPLYGVGQEDRVLALESTSPFSLTRSAGINDFVQGVIQAITNVFWLGVDGVSVIQGAIPTVSATNGALTWGTGLPPPGTTGGPPIPGATYTVSGIRFNEYIVYRSLAASRNIGVSGLPLRCPVRVFGIFGR